MKFLIAAILLSGSFSAAQFKVPNERDRAAQRKKDLEQIKKDKADKEAVKKQGKVKSLNQIIETVPEADKADLDNLLKGIELEPLSHSAGFNLFRVKKVMPKFLFFKAGIKAGEIVHFRK